MTPTTSILVLLATALPTPSIQEINYQPDSEEDEFCHEESMQLGLCLGKQVSGNSSERYKFLDSIGWYGSALCCILESNVWHVIVLGLTSV